MVPKREGNTIPENGNRDRVERRRLGLQLIKVESSGTGPTSFSRLMLRTSMGTTILSTRDTHDEVSMR